MTAKALHHWVGINALVAALAATMWITGCGDGVGPRNWRPDSTPIVSDRVALVSLMGAAPTEEVVYVSLPPGTIPTAGLATIEDIRTGARATAAMANGGFDPVPLRAADGDTLAIHARLDGGGTQLLYLVVPARRRPVVVRTDPPPRKRDVPLNTSIMVVFSEPIDPRTVNGVRLSRAGASVAGHRIVSTDGLRVRFQPDQNLDPNVDYVLTVNEDVRDVSGDPLESSVNYQFTTGRTVAVEWVVTDPTAVLSTPLSDALTFSVYAVKDNTGVVTGSFQIFYSNPGILVAGRVTCFTRVDSAAWIGGVQETGLAAQDSGLALGWRAVDNGPASAGAPDELSLAIPLAQSGLGNAQEFCAGTPVITPVDNSPIALYSLSSGDLLIAGGVGSPPPPPQPPPPPTQGVSQIAYTYSGGGIQVVAADGSFGRQLTSAPGDLYPAWSPDGTKIAFQSDRAKPGSGFGNIYVMRYDGSAVSRLTSNQLSELEPAWSPDGHQIAFDRGPDVFIMNADGSGPRRVTSGGHPSWSPDGLRLVFADPSGHLSTVNTDGSGQAALTSGLGSYDEMPAWSPDGGVIAFHRRLPNAKYGAVYLVNPDGSGVTQLTLKGQRPEWSPDSRRIVFEFNGIYIVNVDGSGLTRVGTGFTPAWSLVGTMPPAPRADRTIAIAGGDGQSGGVQTTLPLPLRVQVLEPNGAPAVAVVVSWVLDPDGNGPRLSSERSLTDSSGIASVRLTLGAAPGVQSVIALVTDGSLRSPGVMFTATAGQR